MPVLILIVVLVIVANKLPTIWPTLASIGTVAMWAIGIGAVVALILYIIMKVQQRGLPREELAERAASRQRKTQQRDEVRAVQHHLSN